MICYGLNLKTMSWHSHVKPWHRARLGAVRSISPDQHEDRRFWQATNDCNIIIYVCTVYRKKAILHTSSLYMYKLNQSVYIPHWLWPCSGQKLQETSDEWWRPCCKQNWLQLACTESLDYLSACYCAISDRQTSVTRLERQHGYMPGAASETRSSSYEIIEIRNAKTTVN
jgi:hypothetical protein